MLARLYIVLAPVIALSLTIDTLRAATELVEPASASDVEDDAATEQVETDPLAEQRPLTKKERNRERTRAIIEAKAKNKAKHHARTEVWEGKEKKRKIVKAKRHEEGANGIADLPECRGRGANVTDDEFVRQCSACRVAGAEAPRLYIMEPKDGLGSRLHDVVVGMAVAARNGFALGGVIYDKTTCGAPSAATHNVDIFKSAGRVFGIRNARMMFTNHPPEFGDAVFDDTGKFEKGIKERGMPQSSQDNWLLSAKAKCLTCDLDKSGVDLDRYFTPKFLSDLHRSSPLMSGPLVFKPNRVSVALHIRRGDVVETDGRRGTSDAWYYRLVEQLRTLAPEADIHVFSSTEKKIPSSSFDGYRNRSLSVHLDGDVLEAWSNLARADVLVMAKSSFSHVPAFFNDKCVVYQPYWHRPLSQWVGATTSEAEPLDAPRLQDLRACIARVRPSAR